MINIIKDLKNNFNAVSIKAEFEDEGLSFSEVSKLKNLTDTFSFDLSVKIGGSGAINDIKNIKKLGIKTIIAPMIESSYAFKKFIKSIKAVYKEDEILNLSLYINIETKTGLNSFDEILNQEDMKYIKGIILGRSDMIKSFNRENEDVNSQFVLEIAKDISKKTREYKKEFIIGGGITKDCIPFLKELKENGFEYFETRKVMFKSNSINQKNIEEGITKALEFEIKWLKGLENPLKSEIDRIKKLENIIKKMPTTV